MIKYYYAVLLGTLFFNRDDSCDLLINKDRQHIYYTTADTEQLTEKKANYEENDAEVWESGGKCSQS